MGVQPSAGTVVPMLHMVLGCTIRVEFFHVPVSVSHPQQVHTQLGAHLTQWV